MNPGGTHGGSGNRPERAADALNKLPAGCKRDPAAITMPPHHPDSLKMRRIWARYHELITVFDLEVGQVLDQLKADGLADNTIVFLMADHGMGLPRYKRWLYVTGLHVPLIVHLPKKFQGKQGEASVRDTLVSYIDLTATALEIAGVEAPSYFAGKSIFLDRERQYVFVARDRADDMFDLSRCVFDGRYLYIRHYLPHLPPMQEGYILSSVYNESLIELHRLHDAGPDTAQSQKLWEPRPFEELYDIQSDPPEQYNVSNYQNHASLKARLVKQLKKKWIIETRDSGFLIELEMHRRATITNSTLHSIPSNDKTYPIESILAVADQASRPESKRLSGGDDLALNFWAIQQRIIQNGSSDVSRRFLKTMLASDTPTVRTAAAEALVRPGDKEAAIPVFRELLAMPEPNLHLYVARSLAISFDNCKPLEEKIRAARQDVLAPPGSSRPWKDFVYSAFTT